MRARSATSTSNPPYFSISEIAQFAIGRPRRPGRVLAMITNSFVFKFVAPLNGIIIDSLIEMLNYLPMPYISGELRQSAAERPIDAGREIWGLFLDPVLDLLKSHVLAHYAEHRLTSSQACMLQRLDHPMHPREAALQLGYDPSNITALAD